MGLMSLFMKLQVKMYESSNGKRMGKVRGNQIFILYTVGRKTGKLRKTPLIYFKDDNNYIIVASNSGSDHNPSWFYNIKSAQEVKIHLLNHLVDCSVNIASEDEKTRLWDLVIKQASFYKDYRKKTTRSIPIIVLTPNHPVI